MQTDATMLERVTRAYIAYRWLRPICVLVVLCAGLLLFLLAGGFPPWAWRLLVQVVPQIPALWAAHGQATLLALGGLVLLSVSLLVAWVLLFWVAWQMLAYWWYERRELQQFAEDMEEAQSLSTSEMALYARPGRLQNTAQFVQNGLLARSAIANRSTLQRPRAALLSRRVQMPDEWDEEVQDEEEEDLTQAEPGAYQDDYAEQESYEEQDEPDPDLGEDEVGYVEGDEEGDPWEDESEIELARSPRAAATASYARGAVAQAGAATRPEPVHYSSYGRFLPASPALSAPVSPVPRLNTILYEHDTIPTRPLTGTTQIAARVPMVQLVVSTGLDVGLKRKGKPNEDSLLALQNTRVLRGCSCPVGLFVIADGMGGHQNGQEASRMVIQSLSKTVVPSIIYGPTDDNYVELLAEGVHHANLEIYQRNRQEKADMGTTIAAALIVNTTAYVANVGDSRVYLYRASSGLSQVTRDHSTVARLVENGLIQPEDVYTHPRRNEIYRSLGRHPSEDIDRFTLALEAQDLLLLCSDGLWEMVRDSQIREVIEATLDQPSQISSALIQAALDGGGKDNVSVIVVCVKTPEAQSIACAD